MSSKLPPRELLSIQSANRTNFAMVDSQWNSTPQMTQIPSSRMPPSERQHTSIGVRNRLHFGQGIRIAWYCMLASLVRSPLAVLLVVANRTPCLPADIPLVTPQKVKHLAPPHYLLPSTLVTFPELPTKQVDVKYHI